MAKKTIQKRGRVESYNISPKGGYEGLLLREGGEVVQVNFARESAGEIAALAPEGAEIAVACEEDGSGKRDAAHPVLKLVRLEGAHGSWPAKDTDGGRFRGRVARLNYALDGQVNGGVLDSGDFLHLKPHGAKAVKLETGMRVEGHGKAKPLANGRRIIEAEQVNGIRIGKPHEC
ncbi:MAG TPA: hypothetical protein VKX25_18170 [Bryobacteraceae bacterium]|jgi:hypothetical protein|nr:hypothetical protein [Bryobacteraceae bacterium]